MKGEHMEALKEAKESEAESKHKKAGRMGAKGHKESGEPDVEVMTVKEAKRVKVAELEKDRAGFPKHEYLFTKRQPVGDYIENLLTHRSQGVPESHYKHLVCPTHEDKIISRGRAGMTAVMGTPIDVSPAGTKHGVKLPDMNETM